MGANDSIKKKGSDELQKKVEEYIKDYDLDSVEDEGDLEEICALAEEYVKTDIQTFGASMIPGGMNTTKPYIKVLIAQNWFIMKKLSRIASLMEKKDDAGSDE